MSEQLKLHQLLALSAWPTWMEQTLKPTAPLREATVVVIEDRGWED